MGSHVKRSFIKGAAILGAAALLSKILGAVYRIPYQNITGDIGLGIYSKVYPIYSMLLILATAGFPIAISKLVSEHLAAGDKKGAKRILKISIYVLTVTGFTFFLALFLGADFLAGWMGNKELAIAIKSVSFALLVVPAMAALRGYYQGHQFMTPTAYSQIVEQIVRVATILVLSYWFMSQPEYGVYYAGAGAVFGAFTGAVFSIIVLILFWKKGSILTEEIAAEVPEIEIQELPTIVVIKRILYYAIPIALGSLIIPLLGVVDSFTVSNMLQHIGFSVEDSEYWFGVYMRGQPLVMFASFFAISLSLALVPSISEAQVKNNQQLIVSRSELALRLSLIIGLPASVGLAVLAEPINIMLYENNVGTSTLMALAFTTVFAIIEITSSGILQGIGQVTLPAKNLFIGILFKLVLNLLLISQFGIIGAAIATVFGYGIAALLNMIAINKYIGFKVGLTNFFLKPTIAVAIMAVVVWISKTTLLTVLLPLISSERLVMAVVSLVSVGIGILSLVISLFISGAIIREDLANIPRFGTKLIKITERLKILK